MIFKSDGYCYSCLQILESVKCDCDKTKYFIPVKPEQRYKVIDQHLNLHRREWAKRIAEQCDLSEEQLMSLMEPLC